MTVRPDVYEERHEGGYLRITWTTWPKLDDAWFGVTFRRGRVSYSGLVKRSAAIEIAWRDLVRVASRAALSTTFVDTGEHPLIEWPPERG